MKPRWPEPAAGDIVWWHFPDCVKPRAKPRPALVLRVIENPGGPVTVQVAYGTSRRTITLYRGEFAILRSGGEAAFLSAGLSMDTKFDLSQLAALPYNSDWFSVPPAAPCGQTPKLGSLHPSLVHSLAAAYRGTLEER